ncbi:MAG: STAS domain-containing protein [Chloroflexi bacterium]|nr:STAS domain-containing protein [Chloroflexota bacterium]
MTFIQITQRQERVPVTVFQLLDRIHLGNFAEMEKITKDAYDAGTRDLVIDLSRIESLTSIGVRALVIVHKLLSRDGGKHLRLAGVSPSMRDVLEIAGITQFIDVYDTVEEAAASF